MSTQTLTADVRPKGFFTGTLAESDPEIAGWIGKELGREGLEGFLEIRSIAVAG